MRKACTECGRKRGDVQFNGGNSRCKECDKIYMHEYRAKERLMAIYAYGGPYPKCACPGCAEDRLPFLSIDHINGGGMAHRKQLRDSQKKIKDNNKPGIIHPGGGVLFRWLRKNDYPSGYRVLCYNCNIARKTGPCPVHEVSKLEIDIRA